MSEVSRMQKQYGCGYTIAYKTDCMCEHIVQTSEELREILEKQDRDELERYFIEYFSSRSKVGCSDKFEDGKQNKKRCEGCEYNHIVFASGGFSFNGCYCTPYKGNWIATIKDCPKDIN